MAWNRSGHREVHPQVEGRKPWLYQDLQMGHFDPLEDFPARNRFIQTVTPWLRDIVAGRNPGSRGRSVG